MHGIETHFDGRFFIRIHCGPEELGVESSQYGKFLQVFQTGSGNALRGVDSYVSASIFWVVYRATPGEFLLQYEGEHIVDNMYIVTSKERNERTGCIQVGDGNPITFTLEGGKSIRDWKKEGCRVVIASNGGYFGYNKETDLMEYFPSDIKDRPGKVSLLCRLQELRVEADMEPLSPEPRGTVLQDERTFKIG